MKKLFLSLLLTLNCLFLAALHAQPQPPNFTFATQQAKTGMKSDWVTTDDTTTSTTLVSTDLSVATKSNEKWAFHAVLFVATDSSTGLKVGVTIPTSATIVANAFGNTSSTTAFKTDRISASATATAAFSTSAAATSTIYLDGVVTNSTTSGNVTIKFETVTAGKVTVKAGSYILLTRLQ